MATALTSQQEMILAYNSGMTGGRWDAFLQFETVFKHFRSSSHCKLKRRVGRADTPELFKGILGVISDEKKAHVKVVPKSVRKHHIKPYKHANIEDPDNHPGGPPVVGIDAGTYIQDPKVGLIKTRWIVALWEDLFTWLILIFIKKSLTKD